MRIAVTQVNILQAITSLSQKGMPWQAGCPRGVSEIIERISTDQISNREKGTVKRSVFLKKSADSLSSKYHFVYMKRLYRSRKDRMLGGVCGGLGEHIDVDPSIIRLVWVIVTIFSFGIGIIVYLVAWIIVPDEPEGSPDPAPAAEG